MKKQTKILSIFLCMVLILTCLPLGLGERLSLISRVEAAGNRQALVTYALSQVGQQERSAGSDDIVYNDWYYGRRVSNKTSGQYAWCHAFVSYCAAMSGCSSIIPKTASCASGVSWFKARNRYYTRTSGYQPQPGDIIYISTGTQTAHHVGIVYQVDAGSVYYVDGNNTGHTPHWVAKSRKKRTDSSILGYGSPAFDGPSAPSNPASSNPLPSIDNVRIDSIDHSHVTVSFTANNSGLAKVVVISKASGESRSASYTGGFSRITHTFRTSEMSNPGKDFIIRIYTYSTSSGGNEQLHEVTYGSELRVVHLPDKPLMYNVEHLPSNLIMNDTISGWVSGEHVEKVVAVLNGQEYLCGRMNREDVTNNVPGYSGENAGFILNLSVLQAKDGDNTLSIRAYTSGTDYVEMYQGIFEAVKLDPSYFDEAWYYFNYSSTDGEVAALGIDRQKLMEHYYSKGIGLGYSPNICFDPKYYLQKNSDVNAACEGSYTGAYNHFVRYCIRGGELRDLSPFLRLGFYKTYGDLKDFNAEELFRHFYLFGSRLESRPGDDSMEAQAFAQIYQPSQIAAHNTDIKNAFGDGTEYDSAQRIWSHFFLNILCNNEERNLNDDIYLRDYKELYHCDTTRAAFWRYINGGYYRKETTKKPTVEPIPTATPQPTVKPTATPQPTVKPTATPQPTVKPTEAPIQTETSGRLMVSNATGKSGDIVPVTISLENNPGITALTLNVDYNSAVMTLQSVQNEDLLKGASFISGKDLTAGSCRMIWNIGTLDCSANGTLVTLFFQLKEDVMPGQYPIVLNCSEDDIYNTVMENQYFSSKDGILNVISQSLTGDADGNGHVNTRDATLILQYYAGWDVSIDLDAADRNQDGIVNTKDATLILQEYAAGR